MADMEKEAAVYHRNDTSPGDFERADLTSNVSGRIKNPLAGKSQGELFDDVDAFAAQYGLVEVTDLLRRGALIAQNPAEFENVPGLTDDEREGLRNEVVHKWRYVECSTALNPLRCWLSGAKNCGQDADCDSSDNLSSCTGPSYFALLALPFKVGIRLVQMAPTFPGPPSLVFPTLTTPNCLIRRRPQYLLLPTTTTASVSDYFTMRSERFDLLANNGFIDYNVCNNHSWIIGLVNSAPYLGSCFIGCWLADPLNSYLGRRGTIFVAAIFCFFPVIGSGFTQSWGQLFATRILMGIGMGAKASTIPVYAAENVPALIRGGLVMSWQMWTAL